MKLYVLRHGLALSVSEAKVYSDEERPLAEMGVSDVRAQSIYLQNRGASIELILSSPLKRARQTAEEAAKILTPSGGMRIFNPLSNLLPGSSLFQALEKQYSEKKELMIVGHQPQLGELVEHVSGQSVDLRPGGLVAIEILDSNSGKLLWSKNP